MIDGWECPKCEAVMSPYKLSCINCIGENDSNSYSSYDSKAYRNLLDKFNIEQKREQ